MLFRSIGLLGGVSSFIGTMLALPNLMGGAALEDDSMTGAMSAAVYSGTDYVLLLFVILSLTYTSFYVYYQCVTRLYFYFILNTSFSLFSLLDLALLWS